MARKGSKSNASTASDAGSGVLKKLHDHFCSFAQFTAHYTGHPLAFMTALLIIVVWAATGPIFHYSDTWQLIINTGTTIVTFLMVFLIQNTQNRESLAVQLKLSELMFAMKGAKNSHAALENLSDDELETLHQEFSKRAKLALNNLENRRSRKRQAAAHTAKIHQKRSGRVARR